MTVAPSRVAARSGQGFSPERRLRRPAEFKHVYAGGKRLGNELFSVSVSPNALGSARLGLSIAAHTLPRAVDRNRLRRVIRESFRAQQQLPAVDIVIGARAAVRGADNARLRSTLEPLWQKIASTCA